MALSNTQFEEIMHEYNQKQAKSADDLNIRIEEITNAVPEYKQCSDEISYISVAAAKAGLRGDRSQLATLRTRISVLEKKMNDAITAAGYPSDYLVPAYVCPDCKDTGYIGNAKCHCFKQAEINLLYRQSNIKDIVAKENFNTFNINIFSDVVSDGYELSPRDNMKNALKTCKEFVRNFPSGDNLLLFGEPGVGKTFLSNCIAKELLDTSHSVVYLSAIELFEYFSSKNDNYDYSGLDNSAHSMQIIECDLLIIDDLGTELINSFTNSKLFYCINQRILRNRSTIISTNFSLGELMRAYSERIFSRISSSYKMIKLIGNDLRIENR